MGFWGFGDSELHSALASIEVKKIDFGRPGQILHTHLEEELGLNISVLTPEVQIVLECGPNLYSVVQ